MSVFDLQQETHNGVCCHTFDEIGSSLKTKKWGLKKGTTNKNTFLKTNQQRETQGKAKMPQTLNTTLNPQIYE